MTNLKPFLGVFSLVTAIAATGCGQGPHVVQEEEVLLPTGQEQKISQDGSTEQSNDSTNDSESTQTAENSTQEKSAQEQAAAINEGMTETDESIAESITIADEGTTAQPKTAPAAGTNSDPTVGKAAPKKMSVGTAPKKVVETQPGKISNEVQKKQVAAVTSGPKEKLTQDGAVVVINGTDGETGPQGPQGEATNGVDGETIVGPQGPKGDKGDQGDATNGIDGINGESIVGDQGDKGEKGDKGDPGKDVNMNQVREMISEQLKEQTGKYPSMKEINDAVEKMFNEKTGDKITRAEAEEILKQKLPEIAKDMGACNPRKREVLEANAIPLMDLADERLPYKTGYRVMDRKNIGDLPYTGNKKVGSMKNYKFEGDRWIDRDSQWVFGFELPKFPKKDALVEIEDIQVTLDISAFGTPVDMQTEEFCSIDLELCSGKEIISESPKYKRLNNYVTVNKYYVNERDRQTQVIHRRYGKRNFEYRTRSNLNIDVMEAFGEEADYASMLSQEKIPFVLTDDTYLYPDSSLKVTVVRNECLENKAGE